MVLFQQGAGLRRTVSKEETKNCPLCGALNYHLNIDCHACSWHGVFEKNTAIIDFQWQLLHERYEEVRLEHVAPKRTRELSEFGTARNMSVAQRIRFTWQSMCQKLSATRPNSAASPRPNSVLPPK